MDHYEQVMEAAAAIQARSGLKPAVGMILGSGLGDLAAEIRDATAIPYGEIPHFLRSTVVGHAGRLLLGTLEDVPVGGMQGRFHFYEGDALQAIAWRGWGVGGVGAQTWVEPKGAGGVNGAYRRGDFMLIRDHIYPRGLGGANPLVGPNDERLGDRFPPLARAYDAQLRALAHRVAGAWPEITLHEGVYAMVSGPSFETGAELRFLRAIGTDAVGMSTAPEVVVARHMGMRVLGLSLLTNKATVDDTQEVKHAEVLSTADAARPKFAALVRGIVGGIGS